MPLTLLLLVRTSLDVGVADVDAILASAAAGSENIYGTGQCVTPRVTGAAARDCHGRPCYLVTPCFVRDTTTSGEAQVPGPDGARSIAAPRGGPGCAQPLRPRRCQDPRVRPPLRLL